MIVASWANLASQCPQLACKPKHQRFKETVGAPQHPEFDLKTLKEDTGADKVCYHETDER